MVVEVDRTVPVLLVSLSMMEAEDKFLMCLSVKEAVDKIPELRLTVEEEGKRPLVLLLLVLEECKRFQVLLSPVEEECKKLAALSSLPQEEGKGGCRNLRY